MSCLEFSIEPGEFWWGGRASDGIRMPFGGQAILECDLRDNGYNQASPFFVSSLGRWLWSEAAFVLSANNGQIRCEGDAPVQLHTGQRTLRAAFQQARQRCFPSPGRLPAEILFRSPQYNTWIELTYNQEEDAILAYAQRLISEGYPPGVLIIDDNWQEDYGVWKFHPRRFRNPKALVDRLHGLGFEVMLWICPFVSPDSAVFRSLRSKGALVLANTGKPHIAEWWNGASAVLDLTQTAGRAWFERQLEDITRTYGIDGFKFDAGDFAFYPEQAAEHCQAFNRIGCGYALNEYRAAWKGADLPLAQRLADRRHSWGDGGLGSVLPNLIAQGLIGYPFVCPDMIGGGEYQSFSDENFRLDEELVVRYAQAAALCPMMQFSVAPWRVLTPRHAAICLAAAMLHTRMGEEILHIAKASAMSGDPMLRPLEYDFPGLGYELVSDQFMLGDSVLVAPVLQKGQVERSVVVPPGRWRDDKGIEHVGPDTIKLSAPIERLIWMKRLGANE
jgi:alpha-glucosidase (family GH31 glycosyl hydrolase)